MKKLLYILLFNISAISFAQDPQLFEHTWYLYSIQATDMDDEYNISEIEPPVSPYIIIDENLEFNGEGACNSFTGLYEYIPSFDELSAIDFMETGEDCGLQLHNSFEDSYFAFISGGFWYSVTQDGTGFILTLENGLFGYAIFKSYPLSTIDLAKNKFQLYPNPVKNELILTSENTLEILKVKIFNVEGKILSTQKLELENQSSIDVSQLATGIYFLNIQDENGNTTIKKFIKQ